jgi:hypothetical protein
MRYWHSPEHGRGSHSYDANNSSLGPDYGNYGTLSVDFSNATYDYDNMPDSLTANSSSEEIDAVATLLYHCGVSLNMAYGVSNSTANISAIDEALDNYFYFENIQHIHRSVYTDLEWLTAMKNELNHWRPMIYSGYGQGTSHVFICDGYDNQDYFHMNWGWGGYANGYFLLTNLNPGLYHYNSRQTAFINIAVNSPSFDISKRKLVFFEDNGIQAAPQKVEIETSNVDNDIQLSVSGSFTISLDSMNYSHQVTLPSSGGAVFVKYFSGQMESTSEYEKLNLVAGPASDTVILLGLNYVPECHAPVSMTGVQGDIDTDTNQVMLTWQPPVPDVVNFSWDSIPRHTSGGTTPYVVIPMHRMDQVDLLPLHNHRMTHVSFIAQPGMSECRVLVYKGGDITNNGVTLESGVKIVDKAVDLSGLTLGEWNSVALDEPIVIDASQELWYGLYVAGLANTSTIVLGGSGCVDKKGNIFGFMFEDHTFWLCNNENFVMKALVDNPFIQYEVYRNDDLLTTVNDTMYADYPPVYAHYTYEVKALWNDECSNGVSQVVNFRAPCHVVNEAETVHACDSFVWNEMTFTESGDYLHEYFNDDDCWQVDTLHLTMGYTSFTVDSVVACDSYTWQDGNTYTASTNVPTVRYENVSGCDSIVNLHLIMLRSDSYIDTIVACDSYTWLDGETYTESIQGPQVTFTDVIGCDNATVTLDLTILHSSLTVDRVETCNPYTWIDGNTYTESTDEPNLVYTNAVGCDSVVTLSLTIYPTSSSIDSVYATEPYTWINGITYTESIEGPTVTLVNQFGCDSVVTLSLTIADAIGGHRVERQMKVWPNPTRGQVNMSLSDMMPESDMEVRIYDMYGRLLHTQKWQSDQITLDLSTFAQGIYIVKVFDSKTPVGTAKISKVN